MPIATYKLRIIHINNVIVKCSFEIHSIFLHLWHPCCIWKEVHFHSLFHNCLVQPLYRCSPEKLLGSTVLFLIEVLWSLFFFFFLFPQRFSAVIFTICSQCIEKLFDLRCGIFFFNLRREKREKRSLNYCHCSSIFQNWDLGISLKGASNISLCTEDEG